MYLFQLRMIYILAFYNWFKLKLWNLGCRITLNLKGGGSLQHWVGGTTFYRVVVCYLKVELAELITSVGCICIHLHMMGGINPSS